MEETTVLSMKCPLCAREMASGEIPAGNLSNIMEVKWLDDRDAKSEDFVLPYHMLQCFGTLNRVFYCADCGLIVTKVKERKNLARAFADRVKGFTQEAEKTRDENAEKRREAQQKKVREKRRKKDPWED